MSHVQNRTLSGQGLERSIQEILAEARNMVFERYGKPVRADVTSGRRRKTAGEGANRAYSDALWPRHMTCRTELAGG